MAMLERIKRTRFYVYIRSRELLICSLLAASVLSTLLLHVPAVHRSIILFPCRLISAPSARDECVYSAIQREMRNEGAEKALLLFSGALPLLTNAKRNCHDLAHRVGDIAYFDLYIYNPSSLKFDYSFDSSICDYGFYHGFFEHLFQEHPGLDFVLKTCDALPTGPEPYREAIRLTCFHGEGHGLLLSQVDKLTRSEWGDIHAFTDAPLAICDKLVGPKVYELSRCSYGIFAELASWQIAGNYGFSVPEVASARYTDCLTFDGSHRRSCLLPASLASTMKYGVDNTLRSCELLNRQSDFAPCIQGIIHAIFVNSATAEDMERGLRVCSGEEVTSRHASAECFSQLGLALSSYFPASEQEKYCSQFPESFRSRECLGSNAVTP